MCDVGAADECLNGVKAAEDCSYVSADGGGAGYAIPTRVCCGVSCSIGPVCSVCCTRVIGTDDGDTKVASC